MQTTYRSGDWYVLAAPGALIALPPEAPDDFVLQLWEREREAGDLAAVIDALTEQASGSFVKMLPFAAAVLEGPNARIAVRGDVTVEVTGSDGPESFSGANVTTWSERFVPNASRLAITVGETESVGIALPLVGGVVRAASASADVEPSDVADLAMVAAPVEDASAPDAAGTDAAGEDAEGEDASAPEAPDADLAPAEDAPAEGAPLEDAPAEDAPADVADEELATAAPIPVVGAPSTVDVPTEQISTVEVDAEQPGPADDAVDGATLVPTDNPTDSGVEIFEQLFSSTGDTPVAQPFDVPAPPPPAPAGDHDGETISAADARALRQDAATSAPDARTAVLPVVSGGAGQIRVSSGQVVTLDRTVIIGRRPRATRASGADLPHLIAVASPQQDISRSHLEIRPEGDTVVAIDLHTTNGSTLLRPGADPVKLHPGEPTLVLSGDIVDLGDGVTVTFEGLP